MNKLGFRTVVTLLLVFFSIYFLYPTFEWYGMSADEKAQAERSKDPILGKILKLGLDLKGGTYLLLEVDAEKLPEGVQLRDAVDRAIEIMRNRVDQFGVTEPLITRQGDKWIVIQLPGIKDPAAAKQLIGKTALLEFRIVQTSQESNDVLDKFRELAITPQEFYAAPENYPELQKLIPENNLIAADKDGRYYLLGKTELTGASLTNAKVEIGGQFGMPHISIDFNREGASAFARITEANIDRQLAIVLDGVVQSAPVIRSRIPDGKAIIEGQFTSEESRLLATVLRAGALPAPVKVIEEKTVGPTLGDDSIRKGFGAAAAGVILVFLFMLIYYGFSGFIADIALFINLIALMGIMAYFQFTLTLPGVAGIALTLAMAVDANVLILERIREELSFGKSVRVAVDAGYQKVFTTIVDSNVTTLIAAVFLFQFGTGPIKGFAVTLTIGLCLSMFTAIVVTKLIYEFMFSQNFLHKLKMKSFKVMNISFIAKRYKAFALSGLLIAMSIIAFAVKGPNYGIDFSGGILMQVSFETPVDFDKIRQAVSNADLGNVELQSTEGAGVIMRLKKTAMDQEQFQSTVKQALSAEFPGNNVTIEKLEYVGPAVGKHLSKQAAYAFIFAFIGMIIYIAFRFKSGLWGVSGVLGIVHDVIVCFGFFVLCGKEIDLTTVAALLTIAGFSINDTIVLFDRIRENMRLSAKESFANIIDKSINAVLIRTVVTTITVFLVSACLFFLGGEVIHGFAFLMVLGMGIGVYSTVFLCTPFVYEWEKRRLERFKRSKA
jgi:protein-export membrane protein SecD/preprotein translocase SecF subunit